MEPGGGAGRGVSAPHAACQADGQAGRPCVATPAHASLGAAELAALSSCANRDSDAGVGGCVAASGYTGHEAELRPVLPLRTPGHAFRQYTSAIRYLSPPGLFENHPSYRLLEVSWEPSGRGSYSSGLLLFDKLDVSEALSHQIAAAMTEGAPPA